MNGLEPLIPIAMFFSVAAVIILRGPIGKGIADRLSGRANQLREQSEDTGVLLGELEDIRYRLGEVEERLDFTERVLSQRRPEALPGGD
jgi:hypothetical protein